MVGRVWRYLRFQDDIRVLAKSESELIEATRTLEKECKKRGLMLSAKKTNVLVGNEAKKMLSDKDVEEASSLFESGNFRRARPQLRKILKSAVKGELRERRARFSLWRLTLLRDHGLIKEILPRLEKLAPLASLVAQYLQPFVSRKAVVDGLTKFLADGERNTSPFPEAPPVDVVPYNSPLRPSKKPASGIAPSVPSRLNEVRVPCGVILKAVPQKHLTVFEPPMDVVA